MRYSCRRDIRYRWLIVLGLGACRLVQSSQQTTPATSAQVSSGGGVLCRGKIGRLELTGENPALNYDNRRVVVPTAVLTGSAGEIPALADWNPSPPRLVVSFDTTNTVAGTYTLVLSPQGAGDPLVLKDVVTLVEPPRVDSISGGAVCASNEQTQVVTLRGSGLQGATASLSAPASAMPVEPVSVAAANDGSTLSITLPAQLQKGGPYTVTVQNAAGCEVKAPLPGIVIAGLPNVNTLTAGPRVPELDADGHPHATSAVFADTRVTLRFDGTAFSPGTRVFVDGVEAVSATVPADGNSLAATLQPLAQGDHTVRLQVGACGIDASTKVTAKSGTMRVGRLNPSTVTGTFVDTPVDIDGDFSAAKQGVRYFVNATLDPTVQGYVELPFDASLSGDQSSVRVRTPAGLQVGGPFDVIAVSYDGAGATAAGILQESLTVENEAVPRIVWKTSDAGGTFDVFGCGFDGDATFSLVGATGSVAAVAQPLGQWGPARFRCSRAQTVTHRSTVTVTAPPGSYRLRVTKTVAGKRVSHDDLYPFVVLSAAPDVHAVTAGPSAPGAGRRAGFAVVAPDAYGRKYLFYGGGTATPATTMVPTIGQTNNTSIECAPVDRDARISRWASSPSGWPLAASSGPSNRFNVPPFGMQVVADGPFVYAAGGATDVVGLERTALLRSRVAHDTDVDVQVVGEPLLTPQSNAVPTGVYHYRIAAAYSAAADEDPNGNIETVATRSIMVRLAQASRVSFKVSAPCGASRDGYQGTPQFKLFRSSSTDVILKDDTPHLRVAQTAYSEAACVGKRFEATIEDVGAAENPFDQAVSSGILYEFKATGPTGTGVVFGASAALVNRSLVVAGGFQNLTATLAKGFVEWTIADDGQPSLQTGPTGQFDGGFAALAGDASQLTWIMGSSQNNKLTLVDRADGTTHLMNITTAPGLEGLAWARVNDFMFLLGGRGGVANGIRDRVWRLPLTLSTSAVSVDAPIQTLTLTTPRFLGAAAQSLPYVFVLGGVTTGGATLDAVDVVELR